MEMLVTLRNTKYLNKLVNVCDGVIVGGPFTSGYNYSLDEIREINWFCKQNGLKFYIVIDNFISEDELKIAYKYFEYLSRLNIDGIYFHDLSVFKLAAYFHMESKLIYDGQTVLCNSLEVGYFMNKGIDGVVLSRELTLEEITKIIDVNSRACDIVIFGHQRLSYSKRNFLTNYFRQINRKYSYKNRQSLSLIEEQRNYRMPIVEDNSGTKIYSDYVFQMYKELPDIKDSIRRAIVETIFIDDDRILSVLRDCKRISKENVNFLLQNLYKLYPDNYSTGFLYQKTNITKDE